MDKKRIATGIIAISLLSLVFSGCQQSSTTGGNANNENLPIESEQTDNTEDPNETENTEETNTDVDDEGNEPEENESQEEAEATEEESPYRYVSVKNANIRAEANKASSVVDKLKKWAEVEVIEEVANEEEGTNWLNIKATVGDKNIEGYILAEETVKTKVELLQAIYPDLDYSPQEKVHEYPSNPRVNVKGVYVTKHSAAGQRLDKLIELAKTTGINTFVIDVKDDKGEMLFYSETAAKYSPEAVKQVYIKDMEAFMQKLKENDIYTIARIVSFKDGKYASAHPERAITYKDSGKFYTNSDKLIWVSAHDRELWEYNIGVAKEAAKYGFNEIQFDYVRFPASNGGKLDASLDYKNTLGESKPKAIQDFLKYARQELSPLEVYISADIYGMVGTTWNDMGLGQFWEAVSNVVDYVSPMMYPSHYGYGEYGLPVPDAEPYKTIYLSTKDSVERNKNIETPATIRPWIQDFSAPWVKGYIKYGVAEVEAQIKALEDNGVTEFMLWNPNNRYTGDAVK